MPLELLGRLLHPNKKHRIVAFCYLVALCSTSCERPNTNQPRRLLVFAAASIQVPVDSIVERWSLANNIRVRVHYAASSILARQIESGAPADIFLCANRDWIDYLSNRNELLNKRALLVAGNRLVLIGRNRQSGIATDASFHSRALAEIRAARCVAIGDPDHVPAGIYAMQALRNAGLNSAAEKKLIPVKDAQAVVSTVLRGACDLGIAYASAQNVSRQLSILGTFPETYHSTIEYLGAVTARSKEHREAERFLTYVRSASSQKLLAVAGFIPATAEGPNE